MVQPTGSGGIGVGGSGDPLTSDPGTALSSAASSTVIAPDQLAQLQSMIAQQLARSRGGVQAPGGDGGMIPGVTMAAPKMPLPPTKLGVEGAIPQGEFQTVGARKAAESQAMLSGIANMVNTARDKLYEKKVQGIQHDFDTLKNAMTGYNEAKATGNQEMMKHNADIINTLVMDPKKNKEFSKAFDVNLNPMAEGDKKGKEKPNPANEALKKSFAQDMQKFQSGQEMLAPQAQAMMRSMPQTLQPDPRYQQYLEGLKAGAYPKAGEQLTFQKDLMQIAGRLQERKMTLDDKDKIADMLIKAKDRQISVQQTGALIRVMQQVAGAKDRMEILERMWSRRSDKALEGVTERTNVMKDKLKGTEGGKLMQPLLKGLQEQSTQIQNEMKIAQKAHDVKKMQQLSQQADMVRFQLQIATQKAAQMTGLNPSDFTGQAPQQPSLTPEEQSLWNSIFSSADDEPKEEPAEAPSEE